MKKIVFAFLLLLTISTQAQKITPIDSIRFFTDESIVNVSFSTDIRALQNSKGDEVYQPATVTFQFADSSVLSESIRVAARGHFRRENCVIPPLLLNFRNETSPHLSSLHKLKLVIGCGSSSVDEQ